MANICTVFAEDIHERKLGYRVDIAPYDCFPSEDSVKQVAKTGRYLYASAKIHGKVCAVFVDSRDTFEKRFGRFLRTFNPSTLELSFRSLSKHDHNVVRTQNEPKAVQHPRTQTYRGWKRRRPLAWVDQGLKAHALRRGAA